MRAGKKKEECHLLSRKKRKKYVAFLIIVFIFVLGNCNNNLSMVC